MAHDVIVLHDFFRIRGGGERLAMELSRGLPADLAFGYRSSESFPLEAFPDSRLFDLGAGLAVPGLHTFALIQAFKHRTPFLKHYPTVIYSGDLAPFALPNHKEGVNIYYCHTPPRVLYDQRAFFLERCPPWRRPLLRLFLERFQAQFAPLPQQMDRVVANSETVRQRIRHYWGLEADVVHPPCAVERFRWLGQEDYYLSTARLEPLKRVERIIDAFLQMPDRKLIVASGGSELARLQQQSQGAANISFTGWIDDARLMALTGQAIATLYLPREEDFGISPVESMAAGKPVIGVQEGGVRETVVHGETGLLLPPDPTAEAIIQAVTELSPSRAAQMRPACERRSRRFNREAFLQGMAQIIASAHGARG